MPKLRVDYHLHPNLSGNNKKAHAECKKWWEAIVACGLDCVIITEHSYKNPRRAFELMHAAKQHSAHCFPGMEYITKEGIDIIIFSKNDSIYEHKELKSFKLTYAQVIDFVKSHKELFSFVTHPYTLGLTSVFHKLGKKIYIDSVNELGAVEISNGAFDNLKLLLSKFPLKFFAKKKLAKIAKCENIPTEDYPRAVRFLAVGSDAHHPGSLGDCFEIEYHGAQHSEEAIFENLTSNHGKGAIYIAKKKFDLLLLVRGGLTALSEFLTKLILNGFNHREFLVPTPGSGRKHEPGAF